MAAKTQRELTAFGLASAAAATVGAVVALTAGGGLAACSSSTSSGGGVDGSTDGPGSDADAAPLGMPEASPLEASTDATLDGPGDGAADGGDAGDDGGDGGCTYGFNGEAKELRCAGLYVDFASKTVAPDVHEYDPGLHLWSDGAVKTRWISLPPSVDGGAPDAGRMPIDTSDMDEWTFPVGTRFYKEFVLGGKRIETRLLWKKDVATWYRTTYQWSADETSATELIGGMLDADGNGYEIPTQADCDTCHNGRRDGILGFEAVGLASPAATPYSVNNLYAAGWISDLPDASLAIPGNATDVAALGYLHANCGTSCHNGGSGEAKGTGFFMRLDVGTLGSVTATNAYATGVDHLTGPFQIPGDTNTLRLAPGDAGASCVYYRMSHRDGVDDAGIGTQMPPIDTHKVDDAGVGIIGAWIAENCQ